MKCKRCGEYIFIDCRKSETAENPAAVGDDEAPRASAPPPQAPSPELGATPSPPLPASDDDDEVTRALDTENPGQVLPAGAPRLVLLSAPPPDEMSDVSGVGDPSRPLPGTPGHWPRPKVAQRSLTRPLGALVLAAVGVGALSIGQLTGSGRAGEEGADAIPTPFDTDHVGLVLEEAAQTASSCKLPGGPRGPGRVHVRYGRSGRAETAQLSAPFADTEVGKCLIALFTSTKVPPFSGKPVIVAKNFVIE